MIPKLPTSAPNVMPRGSAEANLRPPTPFVAIGGDTFAALLQELGSKETVSSLDFASRIQKAQKDAEPVAIPADKRVDPKMPKDLGSDVQTDVSLLLATQKMPRMEPIEVLNEVKGGEPIAIVIEASIPPTAAVQPIEGEEIRQPNLRPEFLVQPHMDATPKSPLEPELLAGEPHKKLAKVPELQLREAEPPQREPEPASLVAIMIGAQDLDELASNRSATAVANQSVEGHALRKRRLGRLESVDLGTSQPSLIQDVPAMPEVFGTSRPLPNVLWGGGRAANFLQVLVLTIQDRASIFVKLPALWDMARHQIRDLVAGRASALGVPVERIEIAGQRPANSQTSLRLEEYRP